MNFNWFNTYLVWVAKKLIIYAICQFIIKNIPKQMDSAQSYQQQQQYEEQMSFQQQQQEQQQHYQQQIYEENQRVTFAEETCELQF